MTCPVASRKKTPLSPPSSNNKDNHQQPGTGIAGPPEGGSYQDFKWVAAG